MFFKTIKIFLPLLKKAKGNILNIGSSYGHVAPDYRILMGRNMPILLLMEQQKQASFNLQSTVQVFSQDSKLDLTA